MANSTLTDRQRLDEAIDLLSSTTVVAIFYTLVFILYCLSFRLCYAQFRQDRGLIKRQTVWTWAFQTVLMICATLDVIAKNRITQVLYIEHHTLPSSPLGRTAQFAVLQLKNLDSIVSILENVMILAVLLWRAQIVWSGTRFVIPLTITSVLLLLGDGALGIFCVVVWNIASNAHVDAPRIYTIGFMVSLICSVANPILMTSAIIVRVLYIRRQHVKMNGKSETASEYLSVAATLIESYALDTLWVIGILITYGLNYVPVNKFFNDSITQVDILTNFLVFYRVLAGRAWTKQQTQDQISTLKAADPRQMSISDDGPTVISSRNGV